MSRLSVVVQPFVKVEMLEGLLRSLLSCSGREAARLLLFSDNPRGLTEETHPNATVRTAEYLAKNDRVMALLAEFEAAHRRDFDEIVVERADRHLGPYGTTKAAVDLAFESSDFVLFAEDDLVFAADALDFLVRMRSAGALEPPEVWGITPESIYFNARGQEPSPEHVARARAAAQRRGYFHQWTRFRHLPAGCFATTRDKWALFGELRGSPRGDVELCRVMAERKRFGIFPIVPRAKNVGMLHPDGFALTVLGKDGIADDELFNTYLLSEDLLASVDASAPFVRFTGSWEALQLESVELRPFEGAEAEEADASGP